MSKTRTNICVSISPPVREALRTVAMREARSVSQITDILLRVGLTAMGETIGEIIPRPDKEN